MGRFSASDTGPLLLLIVIVIGAVAMMFPVVFAYVLLIGGIVLVGGIAGYAAWWLISVRIARVRRVMAQVVRKREKQWDVSLVADTPEMAAARLGTLGRDPKAAGKAFLRSSTSADVDEMMLASGTDCYVTFGFGGNEVEFLVPMQTYIAVSENDTGLLVYQGEQFRHFVKRK